MKIQNILNTWHWLEHFEIQTDRADISLNVKLKAAFEIKCGEKEELHSEGKAGTASCSWFPQRW